VSFPLPVYRDRPSVVPHEGGRIYISVHDAEYLRQRAEWKRKLAEAHPDSPTGTAFSFRQTLKKRDRWDADETAWYARYGLTPPESPKDIPTPPITVPHSRGATGSTKRRVADYLAQHPDAPLHEMAAALGITKSHLVTVLCRLRAEPQTRALTPIERFAAMLVHGHPVTADHAAQVLGITVKHVRTLVGRLRSRGFDVIAVRGLHRPTTFHLLLGKTPTKGR
jgi:biotin operon repressor